MTRRRVYAITTPHTAIAALATRGVFSEFNITASCALGLAAVIGPAPKEHVLSRSRSKDLEHLVDVRRVLEALLPHGPLLGATPGLSLRDEAEVIRFLAANASTLRQGIDDYGDKVQFQIVVRWDQDAVVARAREHGRLVDLEPSDDGVMERTLPAVLDAERQVHADQYMATLSAVADDLIVVPSADETVVLSVTAMVGREQVDALKAAVEEVDASWPDGLAITLAGPLPAVSFAGVAADRPNPLQVRAARRRLGVGARASAEDVRSAYRSLLAALRSNNGAGDDKFSAASQADGMLRALLEAREALQAFDPQAKTLLLARLRREGEPSNRRAA